MANGEHFSCRQAISLKRNKKYKESSLMTSSTTRYAQRAAIPQLVFLQLWTLNVPVGNTIFMKPQQSLNNFACETQPLA